MTNAESHSIQSITLNSRPEEEDTQSWNGLENQTEKDRRRDFEMAKLLLFPSFFKGYTEGETQRGQRRRGPTHRLRPSTGSSPMQRVQTAFGPAVPEQLV